MAKAISIAAALLALAVPNAAFGCAGGAFTYTNTLCSGTMQLRLCLGDRGNLRYTLRKGETLFLQTAPGSSFSWSCTGEPAAFCPAAYCVNGP